MNFEPMPPSTPLPSSSLAVRQARLALSLALLAGLLMAIIQIYFDYQNEQRSIDKQLEQIFVTSSAAASESLWTLSTDLAHGVSEGLVSHPLIVEARIETVNRTVLSHRTRPNEEEPWLKNFIFLFGPPKVKVIPLTHKGDEFGKTIGRLRLKIDPCNARQEFLSRVWVILIGGLFRSLIFAVALFILFYITLTRPIQIYASWIRQIDPDKPESWEQVPPTRKRHDELTAFGEMAAQRFHQARQYFLQLQHARSELKTLNQELENRVSARTEELRVALAHAEHLATTDTLTGLPNRRSFMAQAKQRHSEWQRHERPYALLMVDLDNFKLINDQFGHPAGDQVLISVASTLGQYTRHEDIIGRLGGEEFCILLIGVSEVEAISLAERIRAELAKFPVVVDGQPIMVTASFGLVPPELLQNDFDEVLKKGDQMLYKAKNNGRNQVCIYH